jgi:hypothetical protein
LSLLRVRSVRACSNTSRLFQPLLADAAGFAAKFIMLQYPFVARAFAPVAPLMYIYHAFPFAP